MANKHVQFALRDAQYTTLGEARAQMDRGFALRANLTTDKVALVYPKTPAPCQDPMGQPGSSRPPGSTAAAPIMESLRPHRHAPHDPARWAPPKPSIPPRVPLDQRLTPEGHAMLGASLTVEEALSQMDLPQTHLNLIEKAKVGTRANARLHRKAVGVNLRSNNREMTLINHLLPPTHRECRGRKIKIGTIPGLWLPGPFGPHLRHRPKEAALTLQTRL
jgi:hypothetical protein